MRMMLMLCVMMLAGCVSAESKTEPIAAEVQKKMKEVQEKYPDGTWERFRFKPSGESYYYTFEEIRRDGTRAVSYYKFHYRNGSIGGGECIQHWQYKQSVKLHKENPDFIGHEKIDPVK